MQFGLMNFWDKRRNVRHDHQFYNSWPSLARRVIIIAKFAFFFDHPYKRCGAFYFLTHLMGIFPIKFLVFFSFASPQLSHYNTSVYLCNETGLPYFRTDCIDLHFPPFVVTHAELTKQFLAGFMQSWPFARHAN